MAKEEIKKLLDNSKNIVQQEFNNSTQYIKDEISSLKKSTLDKI